MPDRLMPSSTNRAQILRFSRKRGRPKSTRPSRDTGTPETAMKRLLGLTTEALDLCLERSIISHKQHWCGIHLRWLYTLRHGAPGVRALDLSHPGGITPKTEDPHWRSAREKEFNEALTLLSQSGHAIALMNLCVYNERPRFLNYSPAEIHSHLHAIGDTIAHLRDGLDLLANHWKN